MLRIAASMRGRGPQSAMRSIIVAAQRAWPARAHSASKAAVHQLTTHLAAELAPTILVNAIAPGPFPSKMMEATLRERGDEVGHRRLLVGVVPTGAERRALAETGVDDHPVERAELGRELLEHPEDRVVVGDVESLDLDPAVGVLRGEVGRELVEPVGTPRAQRQVVAEGRELARHLLAQPRARPGDQDGPLAHSASFVG